MKSKYINTFNTTAEYDNYIESALSEFPNVGYDKQAGEVIIRRTSPNNYQIWGTTTATENFNIKLNYANVGVTVDPLTGEFYLQGYTSQYTLSSLRECFSGNTTITKIKKFALDTSRVTSLQQMCDGCSSLTSLNLSNFNTSNVTNINSMFYNCRSLTTLDLTGCVMTNISSGNMYGAFNGCNALRDVYITEQSTLYQLTNNLSSHSGNYIPSNNGNCTIHYNDVDYKWQNNAWTPQN